MHGHRALRHAKPVDCSVQPPGNPFPLQDLMTLEDHCPPQEPQFLQ
jgi:hypothetical protein